MESHVAVDRPEWLAPGEDDVAALARWARQGGQKGPGPRLIGVTGSVASGKSTLAQALAGALVGQRVVVLTTDGFLWPNAVLEARGILHRKGFPESYDWPAFRACLEAISAGTRATSPVYSHRHYDAIPGEELVIDGADVVIVEGLIVLQEHGAGRPVRDYLDRSVFVDAPPEALLRWYLARFRTLRHAAASDPTVYLHRYSALSDADADAFATYVWKSVNEPNLLEHVLPTRTSADLVWEKSADHALRRVWLKQRG